MSREPLAVAREYLQSSSPETRRKGVRALVALAALNRAEAVGDDLAQVALKDADASVQRAAEQGIVQLAPAGQARALASLEAAFTQPAVRLPAHALLTRLRDQGLAVFDLQLPQSQRLRLAFDVRRVGGERRLGPRRQVYAWTLAGALVGAVLMGFLVATKVPLASLWSLLALATVLVLAPFLAHAASASAQPGDRYFYRGAGWLAEVLGACFDALPAQALACVLLLLLWPALATTSAETVVVLGVALLLWSGILVALVRAATFNPALIETRWLRTLLGTLAGWGAGIAVTTAGLLGSAWLGGEELTTLAALFWLLATPTAAGLAAAFARLEQDALPPRRFRFKTLLALLGGIAGALTVAFWTWFFWPAPQPSRLTGAAQTTTLTWKSCERAPVVTSFQVAAERRQISAKVFPSQPRRGAFQTQEISSQDLRLRLSRQGREVKTSSSPRFESTLQPGEYQLEVVDVATLDSEGRFRPGRFDRLFDVAHRVAQKSVIRPTPATTSGRCDATSYTLGARWVEEPFDLEFQLMDAPPTDPLASLLAANPPIPRESFLVQTRALVLPQAQATDWHPKIGELDQACRTAALQHLLGLNRSKAESNSQRIKVRTFLPFDQQQQLAGICDQAVALAPEHGAVRDSRGLAKIVLGLPADAIADFKVLLEWTANPSEKRQRERWIRALRERQAWAAKATAGKAGPMARPRTNLDDFSTVLSRQEVELLLADSRDRDLARWTHDTAQAHLLSGTEQLQKAVAYLLWPAIQQPVKSAISELSQAEELAPRVDQQMLRKARAEIELAATMVKALGQDPEFWHTMCRLGALLGEADAAELLTVCGQKPGAEAWLPELRQLSKSSLAQRQTVFAEWTMPPVPALVPGLDQE